MLLVKLKLLLFHCLIKLDLFLRTHESLILYDDWKGKEIEQTEDWQKIHSLGQLLHGNELLRSFIVIMLKPVFFLLGAIFILIKLLFFLNQLQILRFNSLLLVLQRLLTRRFFRIWAGKLMRFNFRRLLFIVRFCLILILIHN